MHAGDRDIGDGDGGRNIGGNVVNIAVELVGTLRMVVTMRAPAALAPFVPSVISARLPFRSRSK